MGTESYGVLPRQHDNELFASFGQRDRCLVGAIRHVVRCDGLVLPPVTSCVDGFPHVADPFDGHLG